MNFFIKLLLLFDKWLAKFEGFAVVILLITMLLMSSLQVILRNFFDSGIEWGDVFARHLVLWVGFFGATLASKAGQHIRIDALTKAIPARYHPVIDILITVFCIIVSSLLAMAAYRFLLSEQMADDTLFLNVKTWHMILIMPLGFGIIAFRYFVQLIELLYNFSGQKLPTHPATDGKFDEASSLEISVKIKLT